MTAEADKRLFRALYDLCGLDHVTAAAILDRSPQTVRHKLAIGGQAGHPVVERDLQVLRDYWRRIDAGDQSLTGRPADHAAAIAWARRDDDPT